MVPYLLNAIFKVNSFPESSPSFWMRSGACDRSDPDVAIKAVSKYTYVRFQGCRFTIPDILTSLCMCIVIISNIQQ